jgi:hypothetical protein
MRFNRKPKDRQLVAEIERKNKTKLKKLKMRKRLLIDDQSGREKIKREMRNCFCLSSSSSSSSSTVGEEQRQRE